jgi:DNA-binding beta-propeller fold protein YncE
MSTRRMTLATLISLCAIVGGLAFSSNPALALRGHAFEKSFGKEGSAAGELSDPAGIAVNEETGDVYVVDKGNNRVERFSSSGVYESQFDGSATPAKAFSEPDGIAVDNACVAHQPDLTGKACEEFDPSSGDVYVVDAGHELIDKFNATGAYIGQITASEHPFANPPEGIHGIAVGFDGTLWVVEERSRNQNYEERGVSSFNDAVANEFSKFYETMYSQAANVALAVDSESSLYQVVEFSGIGESSTKINKYATNGSIEGGTFYGVASSAVAIERSSDDVYADNIDAVARLTSQGSLVESLKVPGMQGGAVAVSSANNTVYVADPTGDAIDVFTPEPPAKPIVEGGSVADVTAESAVLQAEINPRGATAEYQFEYGKCSMPSTCAGSAYEGSIPTALELVGSDFEVHTVKNILQDLQPHTTYHFRATAHNEKDAPGAVVEDEEQVFTTQTSGGEHALPDGRQWELVSPPDKYGALLQGLEISGEAGSESLIQASSSGDAITYPADAPTETEPQGYSNFVQVISRRGPDGWVSEDITAPHDSETGASVGEGHESRAFSEDLSLAVVQPFGSFVACGSDTSLCLSPEASEQAAFLRTDFQQGDVDDPCTASCYRPLVTGAVGHANVAEGARFGGEVGGICKRLICGPLFQGATPNMSSVVLDSSTPLTETTPEASHGGLYEWSNGLLRLVSILPASEGNIPVETPGFGVGTGGGGESSNARGAISRDGQRIVWTDEQDDHLYMRDVASEETIRLDVAQGVAEPAGRGAAEFQIASQEDTRVFFTDDQRLTTDSGAETGKSDLYECDIVEGAGGKLGCELSDLTPRASSGESAAVQGAVIGASDDGSWVYFVANGVQGEASGAVKGTCASNSIEPSEWCNLYVNHGGETRLVAVLSGSTKYGDASTWAANGSTLKIAGIRAKVSSNGEWLTFASRRSLTGYNSYPSDAGGCGSASGTSSGSLPCREVYLYHAAGAGRLICASCDPTGARPDGSSYVPEWTPFILDIALYQSRYLSNTGRLFFDSDDALVPQDVDGSEDVYEYEPAGIGNCTPSMSTFGEASEGCVSLISSGTSPEASSFLDASENGADVFFLTGAKLASQDYDTAPDVYEAHECTSSSSCAPEPAVQPPPCTTADACRAAPTPQPGIFGAPSSATFSGVGNLAPAPMKGVTKSVKQKQAPETRAQRLAKALRACGKKTGKRRTQCEKQARKRYGPAKTKRSKRGAK